MAGKVLGRTLSPAAFDLDVRQVQQSSRRLRINVKNQSQTLADESVRPHTLL